MENKHIAYNYKRYIALILSGFVLTLIIPSLVAELRYSNLRWLWQIGSFGSFTLMGIVNLSAIINALFMLMEFAESGNYNWYWFILGILPTVYFLLIFASAMF